ncbi:MAG: hypothetical protein ABI691_21275 [Ginsengibacter sp.]
MPSYTKLICPMIMSDEEGRRIGLGLFNYFIAAFDQQNSAVRLPAVKNDLFDNYIPLYN